VSSAISVLGKRRATDTRAGSRTEGGISEENAGILLPGSRQAPPEDLNPRDLSHEINRTALRGEADFSSEVIVRS